MDELSTSERAGGELLAEGAAPVIRIFGELDISTIELVAPLIEFAVTQAEEQLVLDMQDVEFIDSSGIALLLSTAQQVQRLELRSPSSAVRRIIEATGLSETLVID